MIKLGIVGTGGMAQNHARAFNAIRGCRIAGCCDTSPGLAEQFAAQHGIRAAYESLDAMLANENLDAVSVVTPDSAHCAPVLACLKAGLHVMCEKPLSDNLADAKRMTDMARKKGAITAVNFSYRDRASAQKAADLVASGRLGRILHVEGCYLQSWLSTRKMMGDYLKMPSRQWRLSTAHGSMGCLGDLGVHLYDMAFFVAGEIAEVDCRLATFDKGVPGVGEYVFDANDSFAATVRFAQGAIGTLHSSRWGTGHRNRVALKVYGEKGALDLDLDRPEGEQLRACLGSDIDKPVWKSVRCPKTPSMYRRFVRAVQTGQPAQTNFDSALKVQGYLEASTRSDETRRPAKVKY